MAYSGKCMCGAVTITATAEKPVLRACHCDMCRRQTSSMFMSVPTFAGSEQINGPAQSYKSSEWAERGFCGTCGSTLWYKVSEMAQINFSAGLFENAANATLRLEFYEDNTPQGYDLAGDHKKMTTAQTLALFAPDEGDAS